MSILSALNNLTGKQDKNVLAALNSLTGKKADDIEEAIGNLGSNSGSATPVAFYAPNANTWVEQKVEVYYKIYGEGSFRTNAVYSQVPINGVAEMYWTAMIPAGASIESIQVGGAYGDAYRAAKISIVNTQDGSIRDFDDYVIPATGAGFLVSCTLEKVELAS